MAVLTNTNYHTNSIVATPQAGSDICIHDNTHSTPKHQLGFNFTRGDGARFKYVQFGATAVGAGRLVAPTNSTTSTTTTLANIVISPASAQAVTNEVITAGSIGSRYLELTLASISAQQYSGAYLGVFGGNGAGYTYRIKGNTETGTPTSGNIRIELYDKIKVALDSNSDINIIGAPLSDIVITNTTANITCVGVSCATMSPSNYGWVQTKGIVSVLLTGTCGYLQPVIPAIDANGAVQAQPVWTSAANAMLSRTAIGYCVHAAGGVEAEYVPIMLTLD